MIYTKDWVSKSIRKRLPVQAVEPALQTLCQFNNLIGQYFANLELVYLRSKQHDCFVDDNPPKSEGEKQNSTDNTPKATIALLAECNNEIEIIANRIKYLRKLQRKIYAVIAQQ